MYKHGVQVCIIEAGPFRTDAIGQEDIIKSFTKFYEATPADIRQHYPHFTVETCEFSMSFCAVSFFLYRMIDEAVHSNLLKV